jgi:hypothetical protein
MISLQQDEMVVLVLLKRIDPAEALATWGGRRRARSGLTGTRPF